MFVSLLQSGDLNKRLRTADYAERAAAIARDAPVPVPIGDADFLASLRRWRRYEMVRIAWRDLVAWSKPEDTLAELSKFADATIRLAYERARQSLVARYGEPRSESGEAQPLITLGMGVGGVGFACMALAGLHAVLIAVPSLYVALKIAVLPSALTKFNGLVRSHRNDIGSPSGSVELDALRIIGLPTQKLYGPPGLAIGGRLPSITVTGQLDDADLALVAEPADAEAALLERRAIVRVHAVRAVVVLDHAA